MIAKRNNFEQEKIRFKKKWMQNLKQFNITEDNFNSHKTKLFGKFGTEQNDHDVFWSIFNELLFKNGEDIRKLQQIYYNMGIFLYEEKRDGFACLQKAIKMQLLNYKNENFKSFIKEVEVSAIIDARTCEKCRQLNGIRFSIDEALEKMPIPCKPRIDTEGKQNHCRCVYIPITKYDE